MAVEGETGTHARGRKNANAATMADNCAGASSFSFALSLLSLSSSRYLVASSSHRDRLGTSADLASRSRLYLSPSTLEIIGMYRGNQREGDSKPDGLTGLSGRGDSRPLTPDLSSPTPYLSMLARCHSFPSVSPRRLDRSETD